MLGDISVDVLFTTGLPAEGGRCMLVSINAGEVLQNRCMLREPPGTLQSALGVPYCLVAACPMQGKIPKSSSSNAGASLLGS